VVELVVVAVVVDSRSVELVVVVVVVKSMCGRVGKGVVQSVLEYWVRS